LVNDALFVALFGGVVLSDECVELARACCVVLSCSFDELVNDALFVALFGGVELFANG